MSGGDFKPNPDLYEKMQLPYEAESAFIDAGRAFLEAVRKLRVKHRIANVCVVISATATVDGKPQSFIMHTAYGDRSKFVPLLAFALGKNEQEYSDAIRNSARDGAR